MSRKHRKITLKRHAAVYDRFMELHEQKRLRYDDCIQQCMKEFFYQNEATIMRILKEEALRRAPVEEEEAVEEEAAEK